MLRRIGITSSLNFTVREDSGSLSRSFILTVWPEYRAPFRVQIKVGSEEPSHATIRINGLNVIQTSDFANGVSEFTREIDLKAGDNLVQVEVSGPGNSGIRAFFSGAPDRENAQVFAGTFYLSENGDSATKTFAAHPYMIAPYELYVTRPKYPTYPPIAVILNGRHVLSAADFQQDDASFISREIDLSTENTLEVQNLKGKLGTPLGIKIRGKRAPGFPGPGRPLGSVPQTLH